MTNLKPRTRVQTPLEKAATALYFHIDDPHSWSVGIAEPDTIVLYARRRRRQKPPIDVAAGWQGFAVELKYMGPIVPLGTKPGTNGLRTAPGQARMAGSKSGAARVGRKRGPQPKEVRHLPSGKFGSLLAAHAEKAKLSAKDLAVKIGKSEDTVWAYFRGKSVPHIDDWPKIAKALNLESIRDLVPDLKGR
jgi:hypothetical protein